jgi:hypothetical protein
MLRGKIVRLSSLVFVLGSFVFGCFFCLPIAGAQESYRAQHSLQQRSVPQQKTQSKSKSSSHTVHPLRFLGWRQAMRQGPDAVRYFQSLFRNSPVTHLPHEGIASIPGVHSASFSPAQLPGILLRPSLPAGALPSGVVTGDFNGDGKVDWVVVNGGDNTLYIYLGNGDGTSQPPVIIPLAGQSPVGVAAGDLNGDGKLDLAVVESDSNTVGILYGNGDGTFQPEIDMPVANAQPLGIAVADVNKDGKPDLIIGLLGSGPVTQLDFEVLLNEGGGNFSSPIYAPPLISDGIDEGFGISVGDMNGDGIPDLLITGADAFSTTVKTYFGKGDGSFKAGAMAWAGSPDVGDDVGAAVLADVNGDGCPDMTVAEDAGLALTFYNDCGGNFPNVPSASYGVADGAYSLAVADVNGDGFPDIITGGIPNPNAGPGYGYTPGNSLTVRLNDGTGKFGPAQVYVGDPGMFSIAVADLKNDGRPSIITANQDANTTTIYSNDGSGGYGEPMGGYDGYSEGTILNPGNAPVTGFADADVDGDGKPDLVLIEHVVLGSYGNTEPLTVMLNQGNGQFSLPIRSQINLTGVVLDFVMADFRKIGRPDFLALTIDQLEGPSPQLIYAQNTGAGQFGSPVSISLPYSNAYAFGTLGVGDFNNDGNLDFAVCAPDGSSDFSNTASDVLTVYLGKGDGTFSTSPFQLSFASGADCQAMFVGDANGDGKSDVFMWLGGDGGIGIGLYEALGKGDGTFSAPTEVLSPVLKMTMADLNHDGRLDVVDIESSPPNGFPGSTAPQINVYLGQPNGSFSNPVTYTPYSGRFAVALGSGEPDNLIQSFGPYVGDFNGDGNLDIAVFQYPSADFSNLYAQLLIGNGDGTFTPSFDIFPIGPPLVPDLAAYNLLGDGKTALVQDAGLTSAYQIFPSTQAPFIQAQMVETPVISGDDAVNISIDVPSSSDTTVLLAASDPNVEIQSSATISAGQVSVEVPFSLSPSMPLNHWFSISAQSNGTTAVAYNFELAQGASAPFLLNVFGGFTAAPDPTTPGPGESSLWIANVSSTGVASSTFQVICSGLPSGASCTDISPASFSVGPGATNGSSFTIATDSTIEPGAYPFTVTATDGITPITSLQTLRIGDFSLDLQPATLNVPPTGTANFMLNLTSQFGYAEVVIITCSNLPTGATCDSAGQAIAYSQQPFVVNLNNVAAGTYTFTVTGTTLALTHSVTGQLQVTSQAYASLNQSTVSFQTLLVGASSEPQTVSLTNTGNLALNLNSIVATGSSGANGSFSQTNNCGASLAPSNSCTINVIFSPTAVGSSTGTLTLTDNAANSPQVISLSGSAVDFSMSPAAGSSTTATVTAGQTATYNLQIQGNQLSSVVGLSCSSAPPDALCTWSPTNVTVMGTAPVPFQVQISTTAKSGIVSQRRFGIDWQGSFELMLIGALLFTTVAWFGVIPRRLHGFLATLTLIAALAAISGCGGGGSSGGGGGSSGTPAGTYTITITGQCENGARTINLTLIVQ